MKLTRGEAEEASGIESAGALRRRWRKVRARILRYIGPRLGVLNQYAPREPRFAKLQSGDSDGAALPTISIVTPSYQQGRFLSMAIESVLEQAYPHLEYFIQDGASTDCSPSILHEYSEKLSGWTSEPDRGQAHAINRAFRRTSGEIMGWLNSDDLLIPGTLHYVGRFFQRNPQVSVLYGNRILINEHGFEIGRWILPNHHPEVLRWVDFIPQETLFWRRSAWEAVGGEVNEELNFALDWDLLLRFQKAGAIFAHVPEFLGAFRVHSQQKTSLHYDSIGMMEVAALRRATLGYQPTEKEVSKRVKWYLYRHLAAHAKMNLKHRVGL